VSYTKKNHVTTRELLLIASRELTITEWADLTEHITGCRECKDAWLRISGSEFVATKVKLPEGMTTN